VWTIGLAACTPATSATLGSWMRRIILTSRTPLRALSSSALHRSSPACGGMCSAHSASASPMIRCARATSRDRHRGGGEGVAREWRECGASSHDAARAAYISFLRRRWGCTAALAGARLRMSPAYLAGGDDHDAADAGDAAAGFDFGDDARMTAEFAPILGGAPAGQPAAIRPRARARARAHACTRLLACLLALASMSRFLPCLFCCTHVVVGVPASRPF
jgi:hypothetical protein